MKHPEDGWIMLLFSGGSGALTALQFGPIAGAAVGCIALALCLVIKRTG